MKVRSPLALCAQAPSDVACGKVLKQLKNPYFLGDEAGLTQTLGWVDAWTFQPSTYAVAVRTTEDVVAAVKFARKHVCGSLSRAGVTVIRAPPMYPTHC